MVSLTEVVAAVVVHSSAAVYAHLGVPLESRTLERPPEVERVIQRGEVQRRPVKAPVCPTERIPTIRA
jgi:hypothetical protein